MDRQNVEDKKIFVYINNLIKAVFFKSIKLAHLWTT